MLKKFDNLLTILIIATAGADRINIGANITDSFLVSPFLILSTIYVITRIVIFSKDINLNWIVKNKPLLLSFLTFSLSLILSSIFSSDILTSSKRLVLLYFILIVFILMLSFIKNDQINQILFNASILGSFVLIIFNFLLVLTWLKFLIIESPFINLEPDMIAFFIPRLGGYSNDVNRGGFVLTFFTYILWVNKSKSNIINFIIIVNIFMIISTLSRSTYLLVILLTLSYVFFFQKHFLNVRMISFITIPLIILIGISLKLDSLNIIHLDEVIEERFSIEKMSKSGSAAIHLALIKQGFSLAISELKIFLIGVGHGASYLFTTGYYWSGSKYGNFHSQYISIFAENGFISLLCFSFFSIVYPLFLKNKNIFLPILIGAFFFNLFYQLSSEPLYWFTILLFYKILHKEKVQNYYNNIKNVS